MTAVTGRPMTMAVTTSADGIGSTARGRRLATGSARWSMIGAVPPRDIADRHHDDMNAGVDQREADDDPQDIAMC